MKKAICKGSGTATNLVRACCPVCFGVYRVNKHGKLIRHYRNPFYVQEA